MALVDRCKNLNHTRTNISIQYCPTCGEKFKISARRNCNEQLHAERRKSTHGFCFDCGKNLRKK